MVDDGIDLGKGYAFIFFPGFISLIDMEILTINRFQIEKKIVSSLPPIAENLESLLEKYNRAIIDATTGYYVDLDYHNNK